MNYELANPGSNIPATPAVGVSMTLLEERILKVLEKRPGLSDREIAEQIFGAGAPQQRVNPGCRGLCERGYLKREHRADGLLGNYPTDRQPNKGERFFGDIKRTDIDPLSEDSLKSSLVAWLNNQGWTARVAWGHEREIDIDAIRGTERWVIEVKGRGSLNPMQVNYFVEVLGETLQRMDDPYAEYSIALPALQQYRGLWDRLPKTAKDRTRISALLVDEWGNVDQVFG